MITVRCKQCNKELTSKPKVQSCGCPNQMRIIDDKIGAIDLNQVVMVKSNKETKQKGVLSSSDLSFQEERRKRKVRKLDFDIK